MKTQIQTDQRSVNLVNSLQVRLKGLNWLAVLLFCNVLAINISRAAPIQPEIGLWWDASKPGRGYTLDRVNQNLVFIIYSYDENGKSEWTMASGPLTGSNWSQPLQKYIFDTRNNAITSKTIGSVQLDFQDATHALLNWTIGPDTGKEPIELFSDPVSNRPQARAGL